jgi:peptide/nickel transport system permease protein
MAELLARMRRSPQGLIGLILVGLMLIVVVAGPWLAPFDPETFAPLLRYKGPSAAHWLGTDQYGRDILSRLLVGARATVLMAVLASLLGTIAGAVLGTTSAYLGGRADEAIMRTVDAVMSIPSLLMALLIVTLLGKSSANALLAIAIAFTPGMARVTRSVALAVRKQEYVVAPIVVEMTIRVAFAVMLFATLSFLGLGAQPPKPEWGLMVSESRRFMHLSPWMIVWPSVAIATVAIGFNLLGDGLRDALNPRTA